MTPRGVANLDPRGMIGRIYVKYHLTLLHTLNIQALGLVVLEKKIFKCFSQYFLRFFLYKSMEANDPRGMAYLDPRGMIGRIYVEYYLTLLHTKYTSFRPCGFREEDF